MFVKLFKQLLKKLKGGQRVHTPTRIQMEATECGSTALMIILAYYKKYVPAATLRYQCGVSRDGTDAYDLIKAAELHGLQAEGYIASVEELHYEINYPAIVHWDNNHFVVLEGFHKNNVFINDPNTGPRKIEMSTFKKHYSGTVLTLDLTEEFVPGGVKPQFLRPLLNKFKDLKGPIAALLSVEILLIFLGISFAMFSQLFVDEILTPPVASWVGLFLLSYLALVFSNFTMSWIQGYLLNRTSVRISIALSTQFFQHVMRLPLAFFHQRHLSEILRRMNLNIQVASKVATQFKSAILSIVLIGAYLLIINQYDSSIAILTLAIIAFNAILIFVQNRLRKNIYAKSEQVEAQYSGVAIDAVKNIETIRLSGSESFMFQRIIGTNSALINASQEIGKRDTLIQSVTNYSDFLIMTLFFGLAGWKVIYGSLTAGMYVTLQILISFISEPIKNLVTMGLELPMLKMDLMRIDDVMTSSIDPMIRAKSSVQSNLAYNDLNGEITVENLSFGYLPLNEPLIKDVSFKIFPGELVGIAGPNGSGKSTILRLIAGQYYPWKGKVLYDGHNIFETPLTVTQRSVSIAEKEALFVQGTVRENLTFWNPHIKEEQIIDACEAACIHDVIKSRKNGYNSIVDEGASNFSYGQRQRLDIARAILYQPKILILDESISGLEEDLIREIFKNLRARINTLIVISHSERVQKLCDRILIIEDGQLTNEIVNRKISK